MEISENVEGNIPYMTLQMMVDDSGDVFVSINGEGVDSKSVTFSNNTNMYAMWKSYYEEIAKAGGFSESSSSIEYTSDDDPCKVLRISLSQEELVLSISMIEDTEDNEQRYSHGKG